MNTSTTGNVPNPGGDRRLIGHNAPIASHHASRFPPSATSSDHLNISIDEGSGANPVSQNDPFIKPFSISTPNMQSL